jgi:uncharacterized membrane protein
VFALYAHTIMPGLKRTDDHTFVAAFQATDRAIINPWFMLSAFLGALGFAVAAVIANRGTRALPWVAVALALYLIAFVVTLVVNVPLNNVIKDAGNPDHIPDLAAVRARFHEARWAAWNLVRVVTSLAAFGCLTWALVLFGRTTA